MALEMRLTGFGSLLRSSSDGSWKRMVIFSGILLVVKDLGKNWSEFSVKNFLKNRIYKTSHQFAQELAFCVIEVSTAPTEAMS